MNLVFVYILATGSISYQPQSEENCAKLAAAFANGAKVTATVDGARHMGVFSGRQMFTGAFNVIAHTAEGFGVRNGIVSAAFAEVDKARASPPTMIIVLNMLVSPV